MTEAGLPAGYLNMVLGPGAVAGDALARDNRIAFYSFTGSSEVGMKLKTTVGLRPISLELGSNSPTIVHSDADLNKAVEACTRFAFANAGQVCVSCNGFMFTVRFTMSFVSGLFPLPEP